MKITVESLERAHGVLTDSIAVLKQGMPDFRAEGMIAKRVSETFIDLIGAPAVQAGEVRKSLDEILTVTKALSEATVDMTSLDRIDTIRDGLQALVAKLDETPVFASSPAPAEPAVPATPPAPAEAAPAGAPGTSGAPTPAAPALAEPAIPAVPTEPAIAAPLPAEPSAPAPAPVEAAVPAPAPVAPTPPVEGAVEKAVAPAAPVAPPAPVPGLVLSDLTKAFSDAALAMGKTIAAELKSAMQAVPGNVVKTAPAGVPVVAPTVAAPPAEPVPPPRPCRPRPSRPPRRATRNTW